jgi:hypothetical protein
MLLYHTPLIVKDTAINLPRKRRDRSRLQPDQHFGRWLLQIVQNIALRGQSQSACARHIAEYESAFDFISDKLNNIKLTIDKYKHV